MSIRARIEDAAILYAIGRPEAALLCALTAVAATSRRRYPKRSTPSRRTPGKQMGDGEAFETFVKDEMPRMCRVVNFNIGYRGVMQPLEKVFYKWLRCELAHEAALPPDIRFEPDPKPGVTRIGGDAGRGLVLSHGWLDALIDAVVSAPENADQFGSPPKITTPIHLPRINASIGPAVAGSADNSTATEAREE